MRNHHPIAVLLLCCSFSASANTPDFKRLPAGVLIALAPDEKTYCDHFEDKTDCHRTFRANLSWREVVITPSGRKAFLVANGESCGSAGCALSLFVVQTDQKYFQVLGTDGEIGTLASVRVLKNVTKDHYDIQKTWHDGETQTLYLWDGLRYKARNLDQ